MDWELIVKLVISLPVIAAIGRFIYGVKTESNLRKEYRFSKEFLDDTERSNLHPFTLEKGYQAIAGTSAINRKEIEYMICSCNC